jgi:hypothetical protein
MGIVLFSLLMSCSQNHVLSVGEAKICKEETVSCVQSAVGTQAEIFNQCKNK